MPTKDLAAYLAGGRCRLTEEFAKVPIVSGTLDESNVRGLDLCNAAVLDTTGTLVWAPTQVAY